MLRALCTKIRVGEVARLGSTFTAFVVGCRASTSNTGINIESFLETILFFSLRVKRNQKKQDSVAFNDRFPPFYILSRNLEKIFILDNTTNTILFYFIL